MESLPMMEQEAKVRALDNRLFQARLDIARKENGIKALRSDIARLEEEYEKEKQHLDNLRKQK